MENVEIRFWSKVDIRGEDECWNWTAAIDTPGYGAFNMNGKKVNSHVVAYLLTYGNVPDGMEVCHTCVKNRLCCNPHHLYAGTRHDNMMDAIHSGTAHIPSYDTHGERNGHSSSTEEEVISIRVDFDNGATINQICLKYNISVTKAKKIVYRQRWKYLDNIAR